MKFNNLNLMAGVKKPEFTGKDVESEKIIQTEEKVDYKDTVETLGHQVNLNRKEDMNTAFNFKFIPREKIVFNPNNDFDMENIDEMADSILNFGMQHNFVALYNDDNDTYILESGERRMRACDLLHEKYGNLDSNERNDDYFWYELNVKPFYEKGFPVNVKKDQYAESDDEHQELDSINSELRKYKTNIDVRNYTAQERAAYIDKVRILMQKRNQILYGPDAPIPTQAEVAEVVGTSERQLRKYDALNNLIPALRQEFDAGNISINKIPGIAALPEEEQMIFLDLLQKGKAVDPSQIKMYQDRMEKISQEKMEAEKQKEELQAELESMRSSKDTEIAKIIEESQKREEQIRKEIQKAEQEKNEDAIIKLQNDLAKERESSGRLIAEANKSLESTKNALKEADRKLNELTAQSQEDKKGIYLKAELDAQLELVVQASRKAMKLILTRESQDISWSWDSKYEIIKTLLNHLEK